MGCTTLSNLSFSSNLRILYPNPPTSSGLRWIVVVFCFGIFISPTVGLTGSETIKPPSLCVHSLHGEESSQQTGQVLGDGSLLIHEGDNLTLTCCGDYPLEWHADILPKLDPSDMFMVISQSNVSTPSGYKYYSTFTYHDVAYDHTGRYWCRYVNNTAFNDSVYIYSYDPTHLMTPTEPEVSHQLTVISVQRYREALVPCRVTHPNISIVLRKAKHRDFHDVEIGGDVLYDPQKGFRLLYPNKFYFGTFYCMAEYKSKTESKQIVFFYIRSSATPYPNLEASDSHVYKGKHFNLTCKVKVDNGIPATLQFDSASDQNSDRVTITKPKRIDVRSKNGYEYDEIFSRLDVFDARKSDSGLYRCTITTVDGKSNYQEKQITVYDDAFADLTPLEDVVVASVGERSTELSVKVFSVADGPVTYTWYKDGQEILFDSSVYRLKSQDKKGYLSLVVDYVSLAEAGIYTLLAESQNGNLSSVDIEFVVNVGAEVILSLPPMAPYYPLGHSSRITCTGIGSPLPTLSWGWQPCVTHLCPVNETAWVGEEQAFGENKVTVTDSGESQTLQILPHTSGLLRCSGSNDLANTSTVTKFIVTERSPGVWFQLSPPEPVEGDHVQLQCAASLWSYQQVDILPSPDTPAINTVQVGQYSHWNNVTFVSIKKADAGQYQCVAQAHNGTALTMNITVPVLDAVRPFFTKSVEGKVFAEKGSSVTLECLAGGRPLPTIQWLKDGVLISGLNYTDLISIDDPRRLTIKSANVSSMGLYSCMAENRLGHVVGNISLVLSDELDRGVGAGPMKAQIGIIVAILLAAVLISVFIIFLLRQKLRKNTLKDLENFLKQPKGEYNPDIPVYEQAESLPYDAKWEFPKERLRLGAVIGQGAFGRVLKAEAIGIVETADVTPVAVKMVRDCTDKEQMISLLSELKILIHVGQHLNIVNLLGAVTKDIRRGELYVIVEYCHFGNMRNYLLKHKDSFKDTMEDYRDMASEKRREANRDATQPYYMNKAEPYAGDLLVGPPLTTKNLICFAFQVARGMEYLSSRKYIHRDLAARNVLLSEDNIVKICDFGLAKECYRTEEYHKKGDGPVPVKWLAIESLTHRLYTTKSDVWSFGVLLWELFTLGGNPYPGVEINESFIIKLKTGYRMEKPPFASDEMYKVIMGCWNMDPEARPGFDELVTMMGEFLEENVKQYYLDLSMASPSGKELCSEEEECGAEKLCGANGHSDGYLRMSGQPGYQSMSGHSDDKDTIKLDMEEEKVRYHNLTPKWGRDGQTHKEAQPMLELDEAPVVRIPNGRAHAATKGKQRESTPTRDKTSPGKSSIKAQVHGSRNDSDSGNSSNCNSGPQDNDGYLVPVTHLKGAAASHEHEPLLSKDSREKPESIKSNASSGFHSDYAWEEVVPPTYSVAVKGVEQGEVTV